MINWLGKGRSEHFWQFSAAQLVFADETHCKSADLVRRTGYAYSGEAPFVYANNVAHGIRAPCTAVCALGLQGIISVSTVEQNVVADLINYVVINNILPRMQPHPNSVLVLDNAAVHQPEGLREIGGHRGVIVIFIPQYSYDLNPMEKLFHQGKHCLRERYPLFNAINQNYLPAHLHEAMFSVSLNAINYFRNCSYDVSDMDLINNGALAGNQAAIINRD